MCDFCHYYRNYMSRQEWLLRLRRCIFRDALEKVVLTALVGDIPDFAVTT